MRVVSVLFTILFLFASQVSFASAQEDEIVGRWITERKDAVIDILRCGVNLCADVVWSRNGAFEIDKKNPDPALRSRPIIGLRIVSDLAYKGQRKWKGNIYNPESGLTYKAEVKSISPDQLSMRGYIGSPILGKTLLWTRSETAKAIKIN